MVRPSPITSTLVPDAILKVAVVNPHLILTEKIYALWPLLLVIKSIGTELLLLFTVAKPVVFGLLSKGASE